MISIPAETSQFFCRFHFSAIFLHSPYIVLQYQKRRTIMERISNLEILQLIQDLGLVETGESVLADEA